MEEFRRNSLALDEFDFCEPVFVQGENTKFIITISRIFKQTYYPTGNCLSLVPGRRYDRVYCGAACSEEFEPFIKQFVRVGGVLVMPFKDQLLRTLRESETVWIPQIILPVAFSSLIEPPASETNLLHLRMYILK